MTPAKPTFTAERRIQELWDHGTLIGLTDAELLARFIEQPDQARSAAFQELVNRHGPMVMGVCRQILRRPHDAEDAFQATFLVLVRKARTIRVNDTLAPWLYRVSLRTAQRARAIAYRHSSQSVESIADPMESSTDVFPIDVKPLLHEELDRLPEKYRVPIVLCHLEGKSHEQAAELLRWPIGTVSGRLSRGRNLLKSRLERRGLGVHSILLPQSSLRITTPLSSSLVESTSEAAIRFVKSQSIPASTFALTQGVLRTMFLKKLGVISLVLLLVGSVTGIAAAWARWPGDESANIEMLSDDPEPPRADPQGQTARPGLPPEQAKDAVRGVANPSVGQGQIADAHGQVAGRPHLNMVKSGGIVVIEAPDGSSWNAMSLESEDAEWHKMPVRVGTNMTPIMSNDTMAFAYDGENIDLVAAFSSYLGKWSAILLKKPTTGKITPIIGPGSALYHVGNDYYAFSARAGKWGVLHLEGDAKARATSGATDISVFQENRLYVFPLKSGVWSKGIEGRMMPPRNPPAMGGMGNPPGR